jgi:hypothetical protein
MKTNRVCGNGTEMFLEMGQVLVSENRSGRLVQEELNGSIDFKQGLRVVFCYSARKTRFGRFSESLSLWSFFVCQIPQKMLIGNEESEVNLNLAVRLKKQTLGSSQVSKQFCSAALAAK